MDFFLEKRCAESGVPLKTFAKKTLEKMIDYPWVEFPQVNMEPQSYRETSQNAAIAIWSASIHLLGLGMGWSDIEKGLTEWETVDFATGYHPVLDTVRKLCGDDLASLAFHVNLNRDEYFEVFSK
jgi:hypothetical protein